MDCERDRFGLSWRGALAGSLLARIEAVDVLEVLAEPLFEADRRTLSALRSVGRRVPLIIHGVSLGLASASPVQRRRLEQMARVVGRLEPVAWSEHLAFVRAAGIELGHLAAPPRTNATLEGTCLNIAEARRIVGATPRLENVASVLCPPGDMDEGEFVRRVLADSAAPLLLDLHNVYTNAFNSGRTAVGFLSTFPLELVTEVHLAGGRPIVRGVDRTFWLDDHLHDVPDEVFTLLEELGACCPRPLTVILERDGRYPHIDVLLAQLEHARRALARGRARASRSSATS